jgi:ABC-type Zn uptake system ZnuABC Zn-binding protein ZnuA
MTTPESKVKKAVTKILDAHKVYYFFPATHGYGRSGVPDIIGVYNGIFLAIETKSGDNQPTALQFKNLREITKSGGVTFVINEDNINLISEFLTRLQGTGHLHNDSLERKQNE